MNSIDVCNIAKWFFDNNESVRMRTFDGNAKLQKLIYYSQAMYSAVYDKSLFNEKIQAWENGPVVREVYTKKNNNEFEIMPETDLSEHVVHVLKIVNSVYGTLTTAELIEQTHEETPWKELEAFTRYRCNPEIKFEAINSFYKDLKDIYDVYEDYDFDNEAVETISNNNFTYNKNEIKLTEEDYNLLYKIGENECNKTFSLIKSDGKLVLY